MDKVKTVGDQRYGDSGEKKKFERENDFYRMLLTEQGDKMLEDLKRKFHFYKSTDGVLIKEGERRVVLYLLDQLNNIKGKVNGTK